MKSIVFGMLVLFTVSACGETEEEKLEREMMELQQDLKEMGDKIEKEKKELDKMNEENARVSQGIDSTAEALKKLDEEMP